MNSRGQKSAWWKDAGLVVALVGTVFVALVFAVKAFDAGPQWRDEISMFSLARMPTVRELWNYSALDSFPPMWPLVVRAWFLPGVTDSDSGVHLLGLLIALAFLASLWLCARMMGGKAPVASIVMVGFLPATIFAIGENRAYGLASCFLVLTFACIWRLVEAPSRRRALWAAVVSVLFAHCVYYDVFFLGAMLGAGALVAIFRRQWKTVGVLAGIGLLAGGSLAVYLPLIHRGQAYVVATMRTSDFGWQQLWFKLNEAAAARDSASAPSAHHTTVYAWLLLVAAALVMFGVRLVARPGRMTVERATIERSGYCLATLLAGTGMYFVFLIYLHYPTQTWYYIELFCLWGVSLDGALAAGIPSIRPLERCGLMVIVVMACLQVAPAWREACTRRTNADVVAETVARQAGAGDLVLVENAWEGISFNRYYHGPARWLTVPPIDSHLLHRNDLVLGQIRKGDVMAPVLSQVDQTLAAGHVVWVVRNTMVQNNQPLLAPPPGVEVGPYFDYWDTQVAIHLRDRAVEGKAVAITSRGPVSFLENLAVTAYSGNQTAAR